MKDFFKFLISKTLWLNLLAAIVVFFAVMIFAFNWLDKYTEHGKSVQVPDLKGATLPEAEVIFKNSELKYEVIDSLYVPSARPGVIMEQNPAADTHVKSGRKIYLIINSYAKKKVPVPDVRDMSLRQARNLMTSVGLDVDSVIYVPSEYVDLVQEVKTGDRTVNPGAQLAVGSKIWLVVGRGFSDEKVHVPSLRPLTLEQLTLKLGENSLNLGAVIYDERPRDDAHAAKYFLYKQKPIAGTEVNLGKTVDVWLTTDKSKLDEPEEIVLSETFDVENFFE